MFAGLVTEAARAVLYSNLARAGGIKLMNVARMSLQTSYETLSVTVPQEYVYHVELNRPKNLNAMNKKMWHEFGECFENLDADENCRVIILSGSGKLFTAGLDLSEAMNLGAELSVHEDVARKAKIVMKTITKYQNALTAIELCKKPVIAAVHSACIGGGVDLIAATDIRYCTKDAWFQVKEVDIGMAADVGTLQRLPKIVGSESFVRELCFTARKLPAAEALSSGLVSRVFEDKESMVKTSLEIAQGIAKKSPVAVQGTKVSLVYARDHSVQEGLNQIALWNQLMLQSEDFLNAAVAQATKQKDVVFSKL